MDVTQFFIQDEDVYYKWVLEDTLKPVFKWLKNRDEYKFKLEYSDDYKIASVAVYHGGECLLCEEVQETEWL